MRLVEAIAAVAGGTIVAGGLGATAGWLLGRTASSFVAWIASPLFNALPPDFDPAEFGLGLGAVSGLVMGAGISLTLALALILRETLVILSARRARPQNGPEPGLEAEPLAASKTRSDRDWS